MNKVVYIPGMGPKPPAETLKYDYDKVLFGRVVRFSEVAYWSDLRKDHRTDAFSAVVYNKGLGLATRMVTEAAIKDVNDYLFDSEYRVRILSRVAQFITKDTKILIGHSLGSIIAYDLLSACDVPIAEMPLLITIGSPLGLEPVKNELRRILDADKLIVPELIRAWCNFADPLDIVAADPTLKNDMDDDPRILDFKVINPCRLQPHSITGYLSHKAVKQSVSNILGGL